MSKDKKIVVIGGGTGTYSVLSGLKNYTDRITAVVSMADSGGSARKERGMSDGGWGLPDVHERTPYRSSIPSARHLRDSKQFQPRLDKVPPEKSGEPVHCR